MRLCSRVFLAAAFILSGALAWADGIHNPSASTMGDFDGIVSSAPASGSTLACTYTPVTTGTQNVAYTGATPSASGGVPAYTFSETGALPSGLTISSSTGIISGTPTVNGSFPGIQVKVTDTASTVANCGASFTLVISAPAFQGAGDIVGSATAWYGLRAYSAATRGNKAINLCDNAGANCADISTDATTGKLNNPGTLGANNCATSNTCQIKIFYDQSATNSCTGSPCDVSNATAANRPTLTFSCFNSLPCAVFSGSQSLSSTSAYTSALTTGTFSAVAERTGTFTSFNGMIEINTGGLGWNSSASQSMLFDGSVASFTASDSVVHAFAGVFNGASSIGYTDAVSTTGLNPGATSFTNTFSLGQINGASFPLTGEIMEGGYWTAQFTGTNATNMCHNQFSFWGTATSC